MTTTTLYNPGRGRRVTDYTTHVDGEGFDIEYPRLVSTVTLSASVSKGDVLIYVIPTTTQPLRATKMTVVGTDANAVQKFAGIAMEDGAAGEDITVCIGGPCLVNVDATAASYALGDVAIAPTTTAGTAGRVAVASWAATNIAGTAFGNYLGPGSSTKALINIRPF